MATRTQVQTTFGDLVRILDEALNYAAVNTQRFTGVTANHEDTFRLNLQKDYSYHELMTEQVEAFRRSLHDLILTAPRVLEPALREYGKIIKAPEVDVPSLLQRLSDDFAVGAGGPFTVKSRNFAYGGPTLTTTGSPASTGILARLNVDQYAYNIENMTPEIKIAKCIADESSGASKHEEIFEFRGADPNRDSLVIGGSGRTANIKALSARDSLAYISNPSFSEYAGTPGTKAAPGTGITTVNGWTPDAIGNFSLVTDEFFRDFDGDASPSLSLYIKHNAGGTSIFQYFSLRRVQINPLVPWIFRLAVYKPAGQVTGSITFRVGNQTFTKTVTSLATGWNIIYHHSDSPFVGDSTNWYRNFKKDTPVIQITTTGFLNSTEYLLVDDIIFSPMSQFDGGWYALIGGAVKFLRDDSFTWTDTATDAARIQRWFWRAFGHYLPNTTGAPSWTEPA
jgi:hypothetical protein